MDMIADWSAAGLALIYGGLTFWAGLAQVSLHKLPAWAAIVHAGFGLLTVLGGLLLPFGSPWAFPVLLAGLAGIHLMALHNGARLFGRIKLSHHLSRLAISLALLGLAYLSLQ